jgi:hypothetical protein
MSRLAAIITYSLLIVLALAAIGMNFILFYPFHPVSNWTVHVPDAIYHPGGHLLYHSSYVKLDNSPGLVSRHIVCGGRGHAVDTSEAVRYPGSVIGEVTIVIPSDILTPSTCHMHVDIKYQIYGLRTVTESVDSNNFRLE